jgi:hypothetical protein
MDTRNAAFDRVRVDYLVAGGGRVSWALRPTFAGPTPHAFQLQARREGSAAWAAVGAPTASFFAVDPTKRLYGLDRRLEYRVVLTDGDAATHASPVARPFGDMDRRMWLAAREIVRRNLVVVKQRGLRSFDGWLFKPKRQGTTCAACRPNPITGAVTNSDCPTCHGSGFEAGYWEAAADRVVDLSPYEHGTDADPERGTQDDRRVVQGTFVGLPFLEARDVWVDAKTDARYVVDSVAVKAHLNSVPLVVTCVMREAEHSDVVYSLTPPG